MFCVLKGLKGSKYFVKDYLIPTEVIKNGAQVSAVIVMDMILEHDMSRNSQSLGIIAVSAVKLLVIKVDYSINCLTTECIA